MGLEKDVVRRFAALLETGRLTDFEELVAPDFELDGPSVARPMNRAEVRSAIEEATASFDERSYRIEELIAEGEHVMARFTISGTQRADYMGVPNRGKRYTIAGVSIYRVVQGRITREWELVDRKAFFEQLR
jgi:steroid delta-isomerase-like uncharacterized protein